MKTHTSLAPAIAPVAHHRADAAGPGTMVLVPLALAGCGGGGSGDGASSLSSGPTLPSGAHANPSVLREQRDELLALPAAEQVAAGGVPVRMPERSAIRFLAQASFGARRGDIEPLRDQWRTGWLEAQFAMPVSKTHWDNTIRYGNAIYFIDSAWDQQIWEMYVDSPDQLRRRAGYVLSQIFVVNVANLISGGEHRIRCMAAFTDWLERGAFGNFRDLLHDVTLSPAMGYFLSYLGNTKATYDEAGKPTRVPDQNYAREVMQLFTIGTVLLNIDGSPRLADGVPIPSYGPDDVRELAKVFTGWTVKSASVSFYERWREPMIHNAAAHSLEQKKFLGVTIPAGTDGPTSLKIALDTLFNHPNVGPFIGRQIIQRMVTSNPSPAYVERVARMFNDDGTGVRGNMKAVFTQVLMDPEARSPQVIDNPPPHWGKLREPVLRMTQLLRLLEVRPLDDNKIWGIVSTADEATSLGQSPGRAPTVFGFNVPNFSPPGTPISARQLVAPEFQIVDEVSVVGVVNFFTSMLTNGPKGMAINLDHFAAVADNPQELVRRTNLLLAHDTLTPATRAIMVTALGKLPGGPANALLRARSALLMALVAPDYLIQK